MSRAARLLDVSGCALHLCDRLLPRRLRLRRAAGPRRTVPPARGLLRAAGRCGRQLLGQRASPREAERRSELLRRDARLGYDLPPARPVPVSLKDVDPAAAGGVARARRRVETAAAVGVTVRADREQLAADRDAHPEIVPRERLGRLDPDELAPVAGVAGEQVSRAALVRLAAGSDADPARGRAL